jgi:hypothetical protein
LSEIHLGMDTFTIVLLGAVIESMDQRFPGNLVKHQTLFLQIFFYPLHHIVFAVYLQLCSCALYFFHWYVCCLFLFHCHIVLATAVYSHLEVRYC